MLQAAFLTTASKNCIAAALLLGRQSEENIDTRHHQYSSAPATSEAGPSSEPASQPDTQDDEGMKWGPGGIHTQTITPTSCKVENVSSTASQNHNVTMQFLADGDDVSMRRFVAAPTSNPLCLRLLGFRACVGPFCGPRMTIFETV